MYLLVLRKCCGLIGLRFIVCFFRNRDLQGAGNLSLLLNQEARSDFRRDVFPFKKQRLFLDSSNAIDKK